MSARFGGFCFLFLLLFLSCQAGAYIDPVQERLSAEYKTALFWDNIEGKPYWLSGVQPDYDYKQGLHKVQLNPGSDVVVRLPAEADLRVKLAGSSLDYPEKAFKKLRVFWSNGSGLWLKIKGLKSRENKSLVFRSGIGPLSQARLYRLKCPKSADSGLELALFYSRRQSPGEVAPYRDLLSIAPKSGWLRAKNRKEERYYPLSAGEELQTQVNGPCRIKFSSRLIYSAQDTKRLRRYVLNVTIDGKEFYPFRFETVPEGEVVYAFKKEQVLTGSRRNSYLLLGEGRHTLKIKGREQLLLRVLRQDRPDYLLPGLNAPQLRAEKILKEQGNALNPQNPWSFSRKELGKIIKCGDPATQELAARRLVEDNSRSGGPLLALKMLENEALKRPDLPELEQKAEQIYFWHTGFRPLPPTYSSKPVKQKFALVYVPRLAELGAADEVVAEEHLLPLLGSMQGINFSFLSAKQDLLVYKIPERSADGYLQVVIPAGQEKEHLYLKLGENKAKEIVLEPDLPQKLPELRADSGLSGLALLRDRFPDRDTGTQSGLFAAYNTPGPLLRATTVSLPLPKEIELIKVFRKGTAKEELPIALKFRQANSYSLTEDEWLDNAEQIKDKQGLFKGFWHSMQGKSADEISTLKMQNEWLDSKRLLKSLDATFRASVRPVEEYKNVACSFRQNFGKKEIKRIEDLALKAENKGHWLVALQNWAELAFSDYPQEMGKYGLPMAGALKALGEDYLARQLLRSLMLYPPQEGKGVTSSRAFASLKKLLANDPEPRSRLMLYATRALQESDPEIWGKLAQSLWENGYSRQALNIALILPQKHRPGQVLLKASLQAGWYKVFAREVKTLPDKEEKNFWKAQLAMHRADLNLARKHLSYAGQKGRPWIVAWQEGRDIEKALAAKDRSTRMQAIGRWEKWQEDHPGPRRFKDASRLVNEYAGKGILHSKSRDIYFSALKAKQGLPVTLKTYGPLELRLEIRPLHIAAKKPLSGWVRIVSQGKERLVPISENRISSGLEVVGYEHRVGQAVYEHVKLSPGPGRIKVYAQDFPVLVRVEMNEPQFPLPELPRLSLNRVQEIVNSGVQKDDLPQSKDCPWNPFSRKLLVFSAQKENKVRCLMPVSKVSDLARAYEQLGKHISDKGTTDLFAFSAGNNAHSDFKDMPFDRLKELLAEFSQDTAQNVRRKMALLVRWGEENPQECLRAEALARSLREKNPQTKGLDGLLRRLSAKTTWEEVPTINAPAGIRYVPEQSKLAENPVLRARQILLGPGSKEEEILSGQNPLVVFMHNFRPVKLNLKLSRAEFPFLKPQALEAKIYKNDQLWKKVKLKAEDSVCREIKVELPAGRNTLRVKVSEQMVNQFLRVRVERPGAACTSFQCRLEQKVEQENAFFVSTREKPVKVHVDGPAWLRIDKRLDEGFAYTYRYVPQGTRDLVFKPDKDEQEALYRIFKRAKSGPKPTQEAKLRPFEPAYEPVPELEYKLADLPNISEQLVGQDEFELGGQEDGTWSLETRWVRRRNFQEDINVSQEAQKFQEFSVSHRYYHEHIPAYHIARGMLRWFEQGGPTLGLEADFYAYPEELPFSVSVQGELFVQDPDAQDLDFADGDDREWSTRWQARITERRDLTPKLYHLPFASAFIRALSLDDLDDYDPADVDHDVFSSYKANHMHGWSLGDTLNYRPWLDTIAFVGGSIQSNEDMNILDPDHLSLRTGIKQLLGPVQLNLTYRWRHYYADADRDDNSNNNVGQLELIFDHWLQNQDRLQAGMDFRRDLDEDEHELEFFLRWYFSRARGLTDFRQGEVDFYELKKRRNPAYNRD